MKFIGQSSVIAGYRNILHICSQAMVKNVIIPIDLLNKEPTASAALITEKDTGPKWGFLMARAAAKPSDKSEALKRAKIVLKQTRGLLNEMARGMLLSVTNN